MAHPLTQLPKFPVPEEIDAHLKFRMPDSTRQQRAEAFNELVCLMGYDEAVASCKHAAKFEKNAARMPVRICFRCGATLTNIAGHLFPDDG